MADIVIVGAGEFAQIAWEYFTHDSDHNVVAFSVEQAYLQEKQLYDLPVVPFEALHDLYPPDRFQIFVAITSTRLNRIRARLYQAVKAQGYQCVSYISSRAFVWRNAHIGENTFVFEGNVIQHHVHIGNNVILWSGNHIGHRSVIGDHCFLASHVVVSGFCRIGEYCFVGVNATFADGLTVGRDCVIGAGTVILADTEPGQVYRAVAATPAKADSYRLFKVDRDRK